MVCGVLIAMVLVAVIIVVLAVTIRYAQNIYYCRVLYLLVPFFFFEKRFGLPYRKCIVTIFIYI